MSETPWRAASAMMPLISRIAGASSDVSSRSSALGCAARWPDRRRSRAIGRWPPRGRGRRVREQAVEGLTVDLVQGEGPGEVAPQFDHRLRIGAFAHGDVGPAVDLAGRDQAVATGEGIRNVPDARVRLFGAFRRKAVRGKILAAPDPHCGVTWAGGASAGVTTASAGCGSTGTEGGRCRIIAHQLVERRLAFGLETSCWPRA